MGMQGTNGIGVGPANPFGEQFGWYAQQILDRVEPEMESRRRDFAARMRARSCDSCCLRDGSVQNVKVVQASGSYTLDTSAQRAVLDAVPLPPFPTRLSLTTPSVST